MWSTFPRGSLSALNLVVSTQFSENPAGAVGFYARGLSFAVVTACVLNVPLLSEGNRDYVLVSVAVRVDMFSTVAIYTAVQGSEFGVAHLKGFHAKSH